MARSNGRRDLHNFFLRRHRKSLMGLKMMRLLGQSVMKKPGYDARQCSAWARNNCIIYTTRKKERTMAEQIRMADVSLDNMYESPCCGIKDTEHKGFKQKTNWLTTKSAGKDSRISLIKY